MKIITRDEWHARDPKRGMRQIPMSQRTEFIVHHSAGPVAQSVRIIQRYHLDIRRFSDIGYNFLVRGSTGEVYEGRGWDLVGAHAVGHNEHGIGVCVIGNDRLSDPAKDSLRTLYRLAVTGAGHPLQILGHRDVDATVCPGAGISKWLRSGAMTPEPLPVLRLMTPRMTGRAVTIAQRKVGADVDGIYGPLTEADVTLWQHAHGLVADGIVGPKTWLAMGIHEIH